MSTALEAPEDSDHGSVGSAHSKDAAQSAKVQRKNALANRVAKLEAQLSSLQSQRNDLRSSFASLSTVPDVESNAESSKLLHSSSAPMKTQRLPTSEPITPHSSKNLNLEDLESQDLLADANTVIKRHIRLLHQYNEIRDMGMGLMGLIADSRGVRIREVQEEFGVGSND